MQHGLNESIVHVDFMIGSAELDVEGLTASGERLQILKQGLWVLESMG